MPHSPIPSAHLPVGHGGVVGGPFFRRDVRMATLMGRLSHPFERILDVRFTDRVGVAPAGALDQRLQVGRNVALMRARNRSGPVVTKAQ